MRKKFYIYYLAGYPVSGKIIGRISGQISIRYNLRMDISGRLDQNGEYLFWIAVEKNNVPDLDIFAIHILGVKCLFYPWNENV